LCVASTPMRIVVTGATGLIGSRLVRALRERGDNVTVLSRDPSRAGAALRCDAIAWEPLDAPPPVSAVRGADAVVHLAAENVGQRWTARARRAIRDTREVGTRNLVAALREAGDDAPPVLVSASAVGYYGDTADAEIVEDAPAGTDFLAGVCRDWEAAAEAASASGVRVVRVRTGLVLGAGGGALARLLVPFKMGVGGPIGSGRQWLPWIHLDDEVGLLAFALGTPAARGAMNATAPTPVTMREFARTLGRILHRPAALPVPGFALRLAVGEFAEALLGGQRALPVAAQHWGYRFRYDTLDAALAALLTPKQ